MAINPFRFRPETPDNAPEPEADDLDGGTGDWQDNWLSNAMAWGSRAFFPSWCDMPRHWTSRVTITFIRPAPAACSFGAPQSESCLA